MSMPMMHGANLAKFTERGCLELRDIDAALSVHRRRVLDDVQGAVNSTSYDGQYFRVKVS
jgi:hypothetical protein